MSIQTCIDFSEVAFEHVHNIFLQFLAEGERRGYYFRGRIERPRLLSCVLRLDDEVFIDISAGRFRNSDPQHPILRASAHLRGKTMYDSADTDGYRKPRKTWRPYIYSTEIKGEDDIHKFFNNLVI